jgi:hypothetical protein
VLRARALWYRNDRWLRLRTSHERGWSAFAVRRQKANRVPCESAAAMVTARVLKVRSAVSAAAADQLSSSLASPTRRPMPLPPRLLQYVQMCVWCARWFVVERAGGGRGAPSPSSQPLSPSHESTVPHTAGARTSSATLGETGGWSVPTAPFSPELHHGADIAA